MASEPTHAALVFYLDAPMQAWGASSRFRHRKTESFPTKSGIIGLLAAALGIDKHAGDEAARLAPLATLRFSVFPIENTQDPVPTLRLEDFHTVGGGYDADDPRQVLHISRKASGGPSTTVITHRTYLTDARFLAVLEGDAALLERCAAALENPKWGIWFGRKCCLPAAPLSPLLAASREEAIGQWLQRAQLGLTLNYASGQEEPTGEAAEGVWHPADHPLSFGTRSFRSRPVRRSDAP